MPDRLNDVDGEHETWRRRSADLVTELAQSRELLARARELERRRLASALAGVTDARLTALRGALGEASAALTEAAGPAALAALGRARTGLDELLDRFRSIARGVYPAVLRDQGIVAALEELVAGLPRPVVLTGGLAARLGWEVESGLYHPAAAAVGELAGHVAAEALRVQVEHRAGRLTVRIADTTSGRPAEQVRAGLSDEAQRLVALGGELLVSDGDGVVVTASLPDRLVDGANRGPGSDSARAALSAARRAAVAEMDSERRRIERDLHDGAQHHLVSLRLTLGLVEHETDAGRFSHALGRLAVLVEQVGTAEAVLARTATGVSPAALVAGGLAAALTAELDGAVVLGVDRARFPAAIEAAVYFCCLEAVGNARKHAPGATITVRVRRLDDLLSFSVRDDGPGFEPAAAPGVAPGGRGLRNIAARMAAAGGEIAIESAPGAGCVVTGTVGLAPSVALPTEVR